jgi:hypothetical protein
MLDTSGYNKRSKFVIITAVPLKQWLQQRPSVSRYMYFGCFVVNELFSITPVELEQQ